MKNDLTYTPDDRDFATRLFSKLDQHWGGDETGMVRPGYSRQERDAHGWIADAAHALALPVIMDEAGGTHIIMQGKNPDAPALMMGSHLDAVPRGGRYDGPAVVISPLIALKGLRDNGIVPPQDVVLTMFPCEESPRFNQALLGSKLMTGMLGAEFLRSATAQGKTLEEHMQAVGLNPRALTRRLEAYEAPVPVEAIGAFVETHIEQASLLTRKQRDIGIVTAIRGNARFPDQITFHGQAGHTGSTPQDERVDAIEMGASFIRTISSAMRTQFIATGQDLVYAFVRANTPADASPTSISDHFAVQMEVRSTDRAVLERACDLIIKLAHMEARNYGGRVSINDDKIVIGKPAEMDEALIGVVETLAQEIGINPLRMPSGAGHDAATMMSARVPSTMIFLAHGRNGASHVPHETMSVNEGDDPVGILSPFAKATRLNAHLMTTPVQPGCHATRGGFADALMERGGRPVPV